MIDQKWEWTINAVLIVATILNLYQAYDWWKTTQKLRQVLEDNVVKQKMLAATKQAYEDLIADVRKGGGGIK